MRIIISTELRKQLMERHQLNKSAMSRILHFQSQSLFASQLRSDILNHHASMLV